MYRIDNPEFLYLLLAIPLLVLIFILARLNRRRLLAKFGEMELVKKLFPNVSIYKPAVKLSILCLAYAFAVIGLANPQIGVKLEESKREGIDVIIALDVSNSMHAEDVKPNRLENAKLAILKLIDKLQEDRIGLVVFAGEAYYQLPLTTDYAAAKLMLANVDCDLIPTQGTAIGAAIDLAANSFIEDDKRSKTIIVITDGENHEDDAVSAASDAAKKGISVHSIGVGKDQGSPIPIYKNGAMIGYFKDEQGNSVLSKCDPVMLKSISDAGKGRFIQTYGADPDLAKLLNDIAKMEKKQYETRLYSDYEDRFQYFFAAALLLIVLEIFLSENKNKFLTSLNLFGGSKL